VVRKLTITLLIVSGIALIISGTQRWLEKREVTAVVHSLMTSLKKGDRQAVHSLLPPDHPELSHHPQGNQNPDVWLPDPDMRYKIHDSWINGDQATVIVRIQKSGFQLRPTIHLKRSETARWKINDIENLQVDPRWYDLLEAQSRIEGEETAREIEELLKGKPGIAIERVNVPVDEDVQ
jgi:hypothetical protein